MRCGALTRCLHLAGPPRRLQNAYKKVAPAGRLQNAYKSARFPTKYFYEILYSYPFTTAALLMTTPNDPNGLRRSEYMDRLLEDAKEYVDTDDPRYPAILIAMALFDVHDSLDGAISGVIMEISGIGS